MLNRLKKVTGNDCVYAVIAVLLTLISVLFINPSIYDDYYNFPTGIFGQNLQLALSVVGFVLLLIFFLIYRIISKIIYEDVKKQNVFCAVVIIFYGVMALGEVPLYVAVFQNIWNLKTFLFSCIIPVGAILGIIGVRLYGVIENGDYGRFTKPGFFVGVAALCFALLMSPFSFSPEPLSFPKDLEKLPAEASEIAEVIGDDTALLPTRYASVVKDYLSGANITSMVETETNEADKAAMADRGSADGYKYVVVDKRRLPSDELLTLEGTFSDKNYTLVKEDNDYALFHREETWLLSQHADATGNQALFYTLYNTESGALIIVDGGWDANADHVRGIINEYGGHVTAWILTHFHLDHAGAFCEIYENPGDIVIDDVYVSNYDSAYDLFLRTYREHDNPETFAKYMNITNGGKAENIHHPQRGEELEIAGLKLKFFNTYDEKLLELNEYVDLPNNCSLVFSIRGRRDSILFTGDVYTAAIGDYMIDTFGDELHTEYVQCCHHGNSYMPNRFYEAVNPEVMFMDAPQWLMESEEHMAKDLAAWADERGIAHYDLRSGPHVFQFW